ncbi:MAG: biotin--[acetyl-CoA-carboxylase] ligase [Chloroflexales bacterium]|nr:biotin--[acetyl-CoA-carboxylase] ligase [Chloroflexales bacterium]
MTSETLDPTTIAAGLSPRALPRTIRCHATVGSTMDLARELLVSLDSSQLPALVVADEQTAGRGRMGRPWVAPPGSALLASLVLRPTWLAPDQGVALVWVTAVALCEAVEDITPLRPGLKWPNDLLVAAAVRSDYAETDRPTQPSHHTAAPSPTNLDPRSPPHEPAWAKAAGILLEVSIGLEGLEWAILGCGVNVSAAPPAGATRYPAISLAAAAGAPVSRLALLRALLLRIDSWQARLRAGEHGALFTAWRSRIVTLGQQVRVETPAGPLEGLAIDVDRSGGLIVRDELGALHTITAGDVGLAP